MPRKTPTTAASLPNNEPPAAPQIENVVHRSGETVTVACKMPGGLLLRVFDMVDGPPVAILGGGMKNEKIAQQKGEIVRLNGTSHAFGQIPGHRLVGGYALTSNVPKDFWELWLKQNKDLDAVKNNLVFAQSSEAKTVDQANEQQKVRSGLEPLNPEEKDAKGRPLDPRVPRGIEKAEKAA